MMRSLAIAATGMNAQQTNTEVIAHNIANINTTGFKRARAEFTDLIYQAERTVGAANRGGQETIPEGAYIGLGVRTAAVRYLHTQSQLQQTTSKLDVAFNGRGWFQVAGPDGELFYTRAGSFNKNGQGQIVTVDGYLVQPAMTVPIDATDIVINESGEVFVKVGNDPALTQIGQFTVATFVNDAGLEPLGGTRWRETESSGPATIGVAGEESVGSLHQGYLETSNVDPVKEITELIQAQRSYEMNSKVIQAADSMYGTMANIR
jgi:flagellar basal-body rod protein FlgG